MFLPYPGEHMHALGRGRPTVVLIKGGSDTRDYSALSPSVSSTTFLSYTYNRCKGPPLLGGREFLWVTQGQAAVRRPPSSHPLPPLHLSLSPPRVAFTHEPSVWAASTNTSLRTRRMMIHSLNPISSIHLRSFWCHSSLGFIPLRCLCETVPCFSSCPPILSIRARLPHP